MSNFQQSCFSPQKPIQLKYKQDRIPLDKTFQPSSLQVFLGWCTSTFTVKSTYHSKSKRHTLATLTLNVLEVT